MQGLLFDMIMEALLRSSVRIDWGRAEVCLRSFRSCGVGNYSALFLKRKNCGRLWLIRERLSERPEITFTYFKPDEKKSGGVYLTVTGKVKRIDEYEHQIHSGK